MQIIKEEIQNVLQESKKLKQARKALKNGLISQEEFDKIKQDVLDSAGLSTGAAPSDDPLSGKTAAPNDPLSGANATAAAPSDPLSGKTAAPSDPLSGANATAAAPSDPFSSGRETATPDNPQGTPLKQRVAEIEKILKQLMARLGK